MNRPSRKSQKSADDDSATIASRIAEMIREDIVRGNLAAGERLNEVALAKRYGVSRIPLREALRIVEGQGLLEIRAYSGAFVAELSIAEIVDIFEIHDSLESIALRLALPLLTDEDFDIAEKVARKCEREPDPWRHLELMSEFYTILYSCVRRKHLLNLLGKITSHENRYMFAFFEALRMYRPNLPTQRDFIAVLRKKDMNKALEFQKEWRTAQREFLIQHAGSFPAPEPPAARRTRPNKSAPKKK